MEFEIRFKNIHVIDGGDNIFTGGGDLFYEFRVNEQSVVYRSHRDRITIDNGQFIILNTPISVYDPEKFTVSGFVSDYDDSLAGGSDNAGDFSETFSESNNWGVVGKLSDRLSTDHFVHLTGDRMDVKINYSIQCVNPPVILGPSESQPRTPKETDGGVILYVNPDYRVRQSQIQILNLQSQYFSYGDYDLPQNIRVSRPFVFDRLFGVPPGSVSSLKIGQNVKVTLFDRSISERHLGEQIELPIGEVDIPFLSTLIYGDGMDDMGWNNRIVSIKVEHYLPLVQ